LSLLSLLFYSTTTQTHLKVKLNLDYNTTLVEFKQYIENNPLVGGFSVLKQCKETNFMFGVDFNNYFYDNTAIFSK